MLERLVAYVLVMGTIVWVASEMAAPDEIEENAPPRQADPPPRDTPAPPPPRPAPREEREERALLDLPLL